jgi:hypothetical protein
MWPFKAKPVIDADAAAWHVDNFLWLLREFSGGGAFAQTRLVLPKPGFFTFDAEQGHALALRIFLQVRDYCGMRDWEVDLVEDDNPLAQSTPFSMIEPKRHALGTFGAHGNRIQISYVPALLQRPDRLIATIAHELAHYLLATANERPNCADDEIECLTDLAAVFMGFGVFLANTRFHHETYSDGSMRGWRIGHFGYLPEADLIFALALFLRAKGLDATAADESLKPHLAKMLRRAMQDMPEDHVDILRIRAALNEANAAHTSPDAATAAASG